MKDCYKVNRLVTVSSVTEKSDSDTINKCSTCNCKQSAAFMAVECGPAYSLNPCKSQEMNIHDTQ